MTTTVIAFGVVLLIVVGVRAIRGGSRAAVQRLGGSLGLAVPPELEQGIRRRISRRVRAGLLGGVLGGALAAFLLLGGAVNAAAPGSTLFLLGGYFVGYAIGAALLAATERRAPATDAVRFARSGAVTLRDYLAPFELDGSRAVVALGALVAIAGAVALPAVDLTIGAIVIGLAVLSQLFFEIVGRRIIGHGRPAGSPSELAWDDALRSVALREIVTAPLALGVWGVLIDAVQVGTSPIAGSPFNGWVGLTFAAVVGLAAIAVIPATIVAKPQQHYLRRLWPTVAAAGAVR